MMVPNLITLSKEELEERILQIIQAEGISDQVKKVETKGYSSQKEDDSDSGFDYVQFAIHFMDESVKDIDLILKSLVNPAATESERPEKLIEDLFENEAGFYVHFLPDLKNYMKNDDKTLKVTNPFPRLYYSEQFSLLMENVEVKKFITVPLNRFLEYDHASCSFRSLGHFHAMTYLMMNSSSKEQIIQKYPFLLEWQKLKTAPWKRVAEIFNENLLMCLEILKIIPQEGAVSATELLSDYSQQPFADAAEQIDLENVTSLKALVVNHGDLWKQNIVYKLNETTFEIEDVKFIRPMACLSTPLFDITHLMFSSISKYLRYGNWKYVLDSYYECFCDVFAQRDMKAPFDFEELCTAYRESALFGMLYAMPRAIGARVMSIILEKEPEKIDDRINWINTNPKEFSPLAKEILAAMEHYETIKMS